LTKHWGFETLVAAINAGGGLVAAAAAKGPGAQDRGGSQVCEFHSQETMNWQQGLH